MVRPWKSNPRPPTLQSNALPSSALPTKGLFTMREGNPCARVTLASGLKLALVYKQTSEVGLPYHIARVNFTSFADEFRHA